MTQQLPWREGYCDGLLGRDSKNPYDWKKPYAMQSYLAGYSHGKTIRHKSGITLVVEALENRASA